MNPRGHTSIKWLLPLLVLVNLALKLAWAGVNELGGDEPFTVYWALRPLPELFGMLRTENNPPLYFLLLHGWLKLVPLEAAWARVPSAVFSALTVWPLFLLARRLGGLTAAITASLLFTFSQHSYGFAHEARAYPLFVLACTWAMWQLLYLADDAHRHPSRRAASIAWLVAANVLATWAHYFGWLMVGLELVLVFGVPRLRPVRMKLLVAVLLTGLCSLPILGLLGSRAAASLGQGTWVEAPTWEEPYNMLMRWSNAPVVAVVFIALAAWAAVRGRKHLGGLAIPLWWTLVPLTGMFLVSFLFPMYIDRYLLFASIGFYLLVAQAAVSVGGGKRVRALAAAACTVAMAATFTPWRDTGAHPSAVAAQVRAWRDGGTAVVIQPAWYDLTYAWSMDRALFRGAAPMDMALRERKVFPVQAAQLPAMDSTVTSVVHIDAWASLTDPEGRVLRDLRRRYVQVDSAEADRKVLLRFFRAQ